MERKKASKLERRCVLKSLKLCGVLQRYLAVLLDPAGADVTDSESAMEVERFRVFIFSIRILIHHPVYKFGPEVEGATASIGDFILLTVDTAARYLEFTLNLVADVSAKQICPFIPKGRNILIIIPAIHIVLSCFFSKRSGGIDGEFATAFQSVVYELTCHVVANPEVAIFVNNDKVMLLEELEEKLK